MRLANGARRLPQTPLPPSLTAPAYGYAGGSASLDQYQLSVLAQPVGTAAALLAARVPPGMGDGGTDGGGTTQDVSFLARSVPAGIASAQLVLTIAPASSGGSLLRADAQVIWYPPRSAAEYIDPARYHLMSLTVTIFDLGFHHARPAVDNAALTDNLFKITSNLLEITCGGCGTPSSADPHAAWARTGLGRGAECAVLGLGDDRTP
jgi:hypothetical protein